MLSTRKPSGAPRQKGIKTMRGLATRLTLLTLIIFCCAASSYAADPDKVVNRTGTFTLNGCVASAKDIEMTVSPLLLANSSSPPHDNDGKKPPREAHIDPTKDPHVFQFVFHGLKATQLYTVHAQITPGLCDKLVWIGPTHGVIAGGDPAPLNLRAYA